MARAPAFQEIEALPEADRLEGFPHPRETGALLGHEAAEQMLADAFAGGRMHHAWLLAGRAGIGKATLAYGLARHVLARPEERDQSGKGLAVPASSIAARQVAALSHPGLLVLRRPYDAKAKRFGSAIPVDEVRRLKSFLGLTSGDEAWRVVIVDTADDLNLNAANALLKSLEEPPRRCLFVLVASEPSGLLADHPLALSPPGLAAARSAAAARGHRSGSGSGRNGAAFGVRNGTSLSASPRAACAGHCSWPRRAGWNSMNALPASSRTCRRSIGRRLMRCPTRLAGNAQEQRFEAFFELFLDALARLARGRATGQGTAAAGTLAAGLISEARLPHWAALWEAILTRQGRSR